MKEFLHNQTKKLKIILFTTVAVLFVIIMGTVLVTNPELFRGEVLEYLGGSSSPTGVGDMYFPNNYQGRPNQIGEIELITTNALQNVNALSFDIRYNKQQATLSETPVLDGTAFKGFFADVNTGKPWGASVAFASAGAVNIPANSSLLKLKVQLPGEDVLSLNDELTFEISNASLLREDTPLQSINIGSGKITITGGAVEATEILINTVTPDSIVSDKDQNIVIKGDNFSDNSKVYIASKELTVTSSSKKEIKATVQASLKLKPNVYDITIVNDNGKTLTKKNALIIGDEGKTIKFIQDDFTTTPDRVKPDAESVITLWVSVTDPLGVSDIDRVFADLTALGINEASANFSPGTISPYNDDQKKQFFFLEVKVPPTTPTQTEKYVVPVFATNRSGFTSKSEIGVLVSKESPGSVAPEILEASSSPVDNINPGKNVSFLAKVEDKDGVANLEDVQINLIPIGGQPTELKPITSYANESTDYVRTQWFILKDYKIPSNVRPGKYSLPVTARDKTGNEDKKEIVITISQDNADAPVITDSYSTPRDNLPKGKAADFFVNVRDANGAADILEVIIDLGSIGGAPMTMRAIKASAEGEVTEVDDSGTTLTVASDTSSGTFKYEQWYAVEDFFIKMNVKEGTYNLPIKATDKSGLTGEGTLKVKISLSEGKPEIIETYTNPIENIIPGEKINFFANIKDVDGISDIEQVIINLIKLGGGPVAMKPIDFGGSSSIDSPSVTRSTVTTDSAVTEQDPSIQNTTFITEDEIPTGVNTVEVSAAQLAQRTTAWFALVDYKIPLDIKPGTYKIPIEVTDKSGQIAKKEIELKIVSAQDISDLIPKVIVDRAYTTPRVAVNDEETPISIYVFIQHSSALESVIINLGTLARSARFSQSFSQGGGSHSAPPGAPGEYEGGANTAPPMVQPSGNSGQMCPTNSDVILCMDRTVSEGTVGTWYKIDGIVVNKETFPSDYPYQLSIIATDENGRVGQGDIPLMVGSSSEYGAEAQLSGPPRVHLAVSTGPNTVELLFSKPLDAKSVRTDGANFTITPFNDVTTKVPIRSATPNATYTVITLETGKLKPRETYAISVDENITDTLGKPLASGTYNKGRFIGFEENKSPPNIRTVTALSPESVEVVFTNPLKPSSLDLTFNQNQAVTVAPRQPTGHLYYAGENFVIRDTEETKQLPIKSVTFGGDAHIIVIGTDVQQSKREYMISASEIENYSGVVARKGALNRFFTGYPSMLKDASNIRRSADFNGDSKVDFLDFTVFASFYGQTYGGEVSEDGPEAPVTTDVPSNEPPAEEETEDDTSEEDTDSDSDDTESDVPELPEIPTTSPAEEVDFGDFTF